MTLDLKPLGELPEDAQRLGARGRRAGRRRTRTWPPTSRSLDGDPGHGSDLPEASGEAIAREFERYLKRRDDTG